jgi:hypothetical protein
MQQDFAKLREHYDLHGWVLLKNLFSKTEIEKLRGEALESKKELGNGYLDLLSNKRVGYILSDERIITAVKKLLCTENPVYFGDSSIGLGNIGQGFHKDNPDRHNPSGPDWKKDEYPCIRLAIYCQDHAKHSGALALKDKSHKYSDPTKGRSFFVPTEAGDVIVWNLRTTHSGNSMRFNMFPEFVMDPRLYKFFPKSLFKPEEKLRVALFMTFGKKDEPLFQRYLDYCKTRTYMVETWRNSITSKEQIENLESRNVEYFNFHEEAKKIDLSKTYEAHHDLN